MTTITKAAEIIDANVAKLTARYGNKFDADKFLAKEKEKGN